MADILSDLNVVGNIAVSGTVDGVDISTFKSDFDAHTHAIGGLSDVTLTTPSDNQVLVYSSGTWINQDQSGSGGSGLSTTETITQAAHGFIVGDVLRHNGTSYLKGSADTSANAEVIGIVSEIISTSEFALTYDGRVDNLPALTSGEVYFLQDDGSLGITPGTINKPVLVTTSTTSGIFVNYRGSDADMVIFDADTLDGKDSTYFATAEDPIVMAIALG